MKCNNQRCAAVLAHTVLLEVAPPASRDASKVHRPVTDPQYYRTYVRFWLHPQ
jgi:hypothetical protein